MTKPSITIREARMEDLPQVQQLSEKLWKKDPKIVNAFPEWLTSDFVPDTLPNWIKDPRHHPLVAVDEQSEQVVGIVNAEIIDQGETAWLEGIRVDPDYQGYGIGKALTERLLNWGKKQLTIKQFRLVALQTNKASLSLVKKLGFVEANDLIGVNIPLTRIPANERDALFRLSPKISASWEVLQKNSDEDAILEWFQAQWTKLNGHSTIGLGGLFLSIKKENIEYLLDGWHFLAKRSPEGEILGIALVRRSRGRNEISIPSRAILCTPESLITEAIKKSHEYIISELEPETTDLRILSRFLNEKMIKPFMPALRKYKHPSFTIVLMEKKNILS